MSVILGKKAQPHGERKLDLARAVQSELTTGQMALSISSESAQQLIDGKEDGQRAIHGLQTGLESLVQQAGYNVENLSAAQMAAFGVIAGVSKSPAAYFRQALTKEAVSTESARLVDIGDSSEELHPSLESFDNSTLTNFLGYSAAYNLEIARQEPAQEALYRTVVLTPEQGGIDMTVPNLFVQNNLLHPIDGSPLDFGFRRLLDANIDYKILSDESTKLVPEVVEGVNEDNFIASSVVPAYERPVGRRLYVTAPLKFGKRINLVGVSQATRMKRNGQADNTDALDRTNGIEAIYLSLGNETVKFTTQDLPGSRFVKSPESNSRVQNLQFVLRSLVISKKTKTWNGEDLTGGIFKEIIDGDYAVKLEVRLSGLVDLERGDMTVDVSKPTVRQILDETGAEVALSSDFGKKVVDAFADIKAEGYDPDSRLSNANRREQGLQLNTRAVTERYGVKLRAPFSIPSPLGEDRDREVLDSLIYAVRVSINKAAISKMIAYFEQLQEVAGGDARGMMVAGDFEENVLQVEGIGRYLVNLYTRDLKLNLQDVTQSTNSSDRIDDARSMVVNLLRSIVFDILQTTNYEAASSLLDGTNRVKWKVLVVCDKYIENFLQIVGDSRMLGDNISFDVKSDIDVRMRGRMYITLVREGEGPDVLNFGSFLYIPTLVSNVTVTRNNAPRREAMVQPRYQHINHLPILVRVTVTGMEAILTEGLPFRVDGESSIPPARDNADTGAGAPVTNPGDGSTGTATTGNGTAGTGAGSTTGGTSGA